ncbi:hypothetical protein TSH58p_30860 (plasmid) [Azospirillum sp. TSH58]|uniref:hypothetical protein n=1 Tax=Azospirillum sp. TSH58 TaxID=664962 RepID=UPI000D601FC9|nr:hypothetical protein [Azospirillum sp. TSH58]AWJ87904.1 hypothetical protein TSH58p_30860 [Azospirillum sp. TSH58]
MTITLEAGGTHLHVGARGTVRDGRLSAAPFGRPSPCLVVFSDGAFAAGTLTPQGGTEWRLAVDGYTTARGTAIPAKRWLVEMAGIGGTLSFRAKARLADGPPP